MTPGACLRAMIAALMAATLAACAYRLEPPAEVHDPVQVYVVDYGRHASLAMPAADSGLIEWFWGDWHYFALGRRSIGSALRALFASPQATLGYRRLARPEDSGARRIVPLTVERERKERLQARLTARYRQSLEQEVAHPGGRRFVPDDTRYSLTHNSSHMLANWLRQLGVEVQGGGPIARFTVP